MSASGLPYLPHPTADTDTRRDELAVPYVVNAGSGSSPGVLSPQNEDDFFLSTSSALVPKQLSTVASSTDLAREAGILGSTADPVPLSQQPDALPLFSPSEGLVPDYAHRTISTTNNAITRWQNTLFGGIDSSIDYSLPTPPQDNDIHDPTQLRLPSFDVLGIAAPHPDNIAQNQDKLLIQSVLPDRITVTSPLRRPTLRNTDTIELELGAAPAPSLGSPIEFDHIGKQYTTPPPHSPNIPRHGSIDVLTPPDDEPEVHLELQWRPPLAQMSTSLPGSTGGDSRRVGRGDGQTSSAAQGGDGAGGVDFSQATSGAQEVALTDAPAWLEEALLAIVSSINAQTLQDRPLQVLSHALPSPSIPGHAFPAIIDCIRVHSPSSPINWINLLHAVPGRFNLADLPTSPPATPGVPLGASDDYFTTKIFSSAVTAVDYETGVTPSMVRHQLLAAPNSIHLSICERYIPPTSANEFENLFRVRVPSLLVDRLVELAPGNGCMIFLYPTKTGAQTFAQQYLAPVLDPVLRSMIVVNGFGADLSESLGRMTSVERMMEFEEMKSRAQALCLELNSGAAHVQARLGRAQKSTFSLVYAAKHEVELERKVWADWWVRQEKQRIRSVVGQYFRKARGYHEGDPAADKLPVTVVQEVLEAVEKRPAEAPGSKIEVGVFVLKRSI